MIKPFVLWLKSINLTLNIFCTNSQTLVNAECVRAFQVISCIRSVKLKLETINMP